MFWLGEGAVVVSTGTGGAGSGVRSRSGRGEVALRRVRLARGVGSGDLVASLMRVLRRSARGVSCSCVGDLAWNREERRLGFGEGERCEEVALMSSETDEIAELERLERVTRDPLRERDISSTSISLTSDSARRRCSRRSSLAASFIARRRPYGEIIEETAFSPTPSHSEPWRVFFARSAASAWAVARGTAIALRKVRDDEPTRDAGRPVAGRAADASIRCGLRIVSKAARIRSASF